MYLCCDLGGTTADWAVWAPGRGPVFRRTLRVADHSGFPDLLRAVLAETGGASLSHATFGVAGPVRDRRASLVNADGWDIDAVEAEALLAPHGAPRVTLVNDFEAAALGLLARLEAGLAPDDLVSVSGAPDTAPRPGARSLICGPGTGLGCAVAVEGLLFEGRPYVFDTEGGRRVFAPETEEQRALFCAPGFAPMEYEALLSRRGLAALHARLGGDDADSAEVVGRAAGGDPAARRAALMFAEILGQFCGNAVPGHLPTRIFLWGGVAAALPRDILRAGFAAGYEARAAHPPDLPKPPVAMLTDPDLPLLGCAWRSSFEVTEG